MPETSARRTLWYPTLFVRHVVFIYLIIWWRRDFSLIEFMVVGFSGMLCSLLRFLGPHKRCTAAAAVVVIVVIAVAFFSSLTFNSLLVVSFHSYVTHYNWKNWTSAVIPVCYSVRYMHGSVHTHHTMLWSISVDRCLEGAVLLTTRTNSNETNSNNFSCSIVFGVGVVAAVTFPIN